MAEKEKPGRQLFGEIETEVGDDLPTILYYRAAVRALKAQFAEQEAIIRRLRSELDALKPRFAGDGQDKRPPAPAAPLES